MKGSSYFLVVVMVMMGLTVASSFTLQSFSSKVLPVAFGSLGLILCSIQLARENRKAKAGAEGKTKRGSQESWGAYLLNLAWISGFVIAIYAVGVIAAVTVFLGGYMKWLGAKWRAALISSVISPVVIYFLFKVLEIELPWGVLPEVLGW